MTNSSLLNKSIEKLEEENDALKQAVRWLSSLVTDFYMCRDEAFSHLPDDEAVVNHIVNNMPIIQGTRSQMRLQKMGENAPATLDFRIMERILEGEK